MMLMLLAAVAATPTYLECELQQDGQVLPVEIVADENGQKAVVSLPTTGRTVTRTSIFTPTEVRIPDDMDMTWIINRVDLSFQRVMNIGETFTDNGKCEVKPAPAERAF